MNVATDLSLDDGRQVLRPGRLKSLTSDQEGARRLLAGPQKHTCLVGGARSGKTTILVRSLITRALRAEGSRHLMVRHRANALKASVWLDTFPKVLRLWFPGVKVEERYGSFFEFENGSQIWGGGLDDEERVDKILGQEYATIYAGECSQIPYSSVLVLRTRLAQPGTGLKLKGYYDLNPTVTSHWTNIEFGNHLDPLSRLPLPDPENYSRMFMNPEGNKENLDSGFLQSLANMPQKYKDRFYHGKYVKDVEGALWTVDGLELCRCERVEPDPDGRRLLDYRRIVVGVDPSGAESKYDIKHDEIGIVTAGLRFDGSAVVLEDATLLGSPKEWATAVVAQYKKWHADLIVAEKNFGGAMVESNIRAINKYVPIKMVNASRGKMRRAEPVAALYEPPDPKVFHAGRHEKLEEELGWFSNKGYLGTQSPNRADAMMWALTELMLDPNESTYTLAYIR